MSEREEILIIGNGMVGHRFVEALLRQEASHRFSVTVIGEEPRRAYDRVHLSEYFENRSAEKLYLCDPDFYEANGIRLISGDPAISIDRDKKLVQTLSGKSYSYGRLVLATGSSPFVPAFDGGDKEGIFVYRTIEDLEAILDYAGKVETAAVMGGGLLGLEAAKALVDLNKKTHVVEFASRLMPRQLDDGASSMLQSSIEALGVQIHLNKQTTEATGTESLVGLRFKDGEELAVGMLVISAGIRPRDELARKANLEVGERGGVVVNAELKTSDPSIYAIGEVASVNGFVYGLVAPGYEMAECLAHNLCNSQSPAETYTGSDLSTKLKLIGVEVASFGDALGESDHLPIVFRSERAGTYKKLVLSPDGKRLMGGILVGDASTYGNLLSLYLNGIELPAEPEALIAGAALEMGAGDLPETAKVCSCNNVSKGDILGCISDGHCDMGSLKNVSRAGTGCGGCLPQVQNILKAELKAQGKVVTQHLCEHFAYSRQELFQIVKVEELKSFAAVLDHAGSGRGCEICKPAIASLLASLWNEPIQNHREIQDTNDKFLANIQKGGTYSVVPRIPGGEITPEKLIVIGEVAKKYGLYLKITGGQRIDLLGARVEQLPDIWKELVDEGFESGHAYGKAMRTVKSCVGSAWCRYGVQDSTAFAIRIEERYRGIRAPHKLKSAVSGCIRECAEARGKDFGIIATEKGWNLYLGGNGGSNPKHAALFAEDLDEETCIRYIDRFLMFYIQTADKLTRTAHWMEQLEGGLDYLRDVIIHDRLGINATLDAQMAALVGSYHCEWKKVVEDPELQTKFRPFINSESSDQSIQFVEQRGQIQPMVDEIDLVSAR